MDFLDLQVHAVISASYSIFATALLFNIKTILRKSRFFTPFVIYSPQYFFRDHALLDIFALQLPKASICYSSQYIFRD
ncbi:MAG TPA: hypothetical protein VHK67_06750 [Rhabdochlamydiaceae bacterium]|nr:hypothetical protein [Rhabdochlamydiaceae bacterium]